MNVAGAAPRDFSEAFALDDPAPSGQGAEKVKEVETNPHKIDQRQKQVDFGKNTLGYENYRKQVAKNQRSKDIDRHPRTPNVRQVCSKRSWDGQVKKWRRALHKWDPAAGDDEEHVHLPAAALIPPHRKAEGEQPAYGGGGSEPSLKRKADDDLKDTGAAACAFITSNPCLRPTTPGWDKKQRVESIECSELQCDAAAAAVTPATAGGAVHGSVQEDVDDGQKLIVFQPILNRLATAATATTAKGVEVTVGVKVEACPSIFDDTNEFEEEVDYIQIPSKPTAATASFFTLE